MCVSVPGTVTVLTGLACDPHSPVRQASKGTGATEGVVHDGSPDAPTQHMGNYTYFLPNLPRGLLLQCLCHFCLHWSVLLPFAPIPAAHWLSCQHQHQFSAEGLPLGRGLC